MASAGSWPLDTVGERIAFARLALHGWSQIRFGNLLGVTRETVRVWEERGAGLRQLAKIATVCQVRREWLETGKGPIMDPAVASIIETASEIFAKGDTGQLGQLERQLQDLADRLHALEQLKPLVAHVDELLQLARLSKSDDDG